MGAGLRLGFFKLFHFALFFPKGIVQLIFDDRILEGLVQKHFGGEGGGGGGGREREREREIDREERERERKRVCE